VDVNRILQVFCDSPNSSAAKDPSMPNQAERIRCRQITADDIRPLAELLTKGFPEREIGYWLGALDTLKTREAPADFPRYGYLLEAGQTIVGVILLIFTPVLEAGGQPVRCNVSSWYVEPAYRLHATAMISAALRFKGVTYVNISPAPHTWPILEAQGYRRYTQGQFLGVPALSVAGLGGRVRLYNPARDDHRLSPAEAALMRDHAAKGCMALVCQRGGEAIPFVFMRRPTRFGKIVMQLAYCRDTTDFTRNAGPIGRFLARRGVAVVFCDGEGPIAGLIGRFLKDRSPKYFRGADRPRLNDLAYTEAVLFGL
jgi:hypothetical protein